MEEEEKHGFRFAFCVIKNISTIAVIAFYFTILLALFTMSSSFIWEEFIVSAIE